MNDFENVSMAVTRISSKKKLVKRQPGNESLSSLKFDKCFIENIIVQIIVDSKKSAIEGMERCGIIFSHPYERNNKKFVNSKRIIIARYNLHE